MDHSPGACEGQTFTPKNLICSERVQAWKRHLETVSGLCAWTVRHGAEEQRQEDLTNEFMYLPSKDIRYHVVTHTTDCLFCFDLNCLFY